MNSKSLVKNNDAQVALEFSFMMMLGFVFLILLLSTASYFLVTKQKEQMTTELRYELTNIQKELIIASSVQEGYRREIQIPQKINNQEFTIIQSDSILEFKLSNGYADSIIIPEVQGSISKGTNILTKKQGLVYIN